jgi:hypothetical protein
MREGAVEIEECHGAGSGERAIDDALSGFVQIITRECG